VRGSWAARPPARRLPTPSAPSATSTEPRRAVTRASRGSVRCGAVRPRPRAGPTGEGVPPARRDRSGPRRLAHRTSTAEPTGCPDDQGGFRRGTRGSERPALTGPARPPALQWTHVLRARFVGRPRGLRCHVRHAGPLFATAPGGRPRGTGLEERLYRQPPPGQRGRAGVRVAGSRRHDVHRHRSGLAHGPLLQARTAVLVGERMDRARDRRWRPRRRPTDASLASTLQSTAGAPHLSQLGLAVARTRTQLGALTPLAGTVLNRPAGAVATITGNACRLPRQEPNRPGPAPWQTSPVPMENACVDESKGSGRTSHRPARF